MRRTAFSAAIILVALLAGSAASPGVRGAPRAAPAVAVVTPLDALPDPTVAAHVRAAVLRAARELPGLSLRHITVAPAAGDPGWRPSSGPGATDAAAAAAGDLRGLLTELIRGGTVTVLVGVEPVAVVHALATANPAARFVTIDGRFIDPLPPNVRQVGFRDEQAAFLAGAAAAAGTRTGRVGIIAGARSRHGGLRFAYVGGARYVDPSVRVLSDLVGFDLEVDRRAAKWAQVAGAQFRLGADVVFAAGPPSLTELLRTAEAAGGRVIGLGSATSHLRTPASLRGHLLAMIVKDYERAVGDAVRMIAAGRFASGHVWYGVPDGVRYLEPAPPRLTDIAAAVAARRIAVPYDAATLDRFLRALPASP